MRHAPDSADLSFTIVMAQSDSDEFELVDSLAVAKDIAFLRKPDVSKIRTWLNPTNYTASSSEYHRHLSSQVPGTGEWIRETSQFKQWHSSDSHGSIWIKAVPGAGKSVVAASMVDSLAQNEGVPVLYFFFRQIIETNRQSRSLLRDWLCQLLHASEIIQISLWDLIEDKKALDTVSTDQLWKMLLSGLRSVEKAYILVDALDEMDLDNDFLGRLNDLGSFRPAHVKVMMTSRPKQYLQRAMRDSQVIHVSLEEELVKQDISVFVSQRVSQLGGLSWNSQELVHDIVCTRSQGLFLYARLMLDQVAKLSESGFLDNGGLVRDMIVKIPFGLEEMYNRMLFEHAESSRVHQDIQVLILQLVTQSARPLRLIEIAKAIEASHLNLSRSSKEIVRIACGPPVGDHGRRSRSNSPSLFHGVCSGYRSPSQGQSSVSSH
jgi:NACHT domain